VYDRLVKVRHRVGFVGAGYISFFHAAAIRRIPAIELAGVYDIDPRRCEQTARALGTCAVSSLESLRDRGADVIHVLTPPETHADVAVASLELGAHVLVEKPLATDTDDCRRIQAAAARNGLRVCVDHSLLFEPQIMRGLRAVHAGSIGRIVSVDILRSAEYPPYEGGPLPPQYRSAGFPFRDLGVHQLYLLQAFLGPIEDVRADWSSEGGDPNLFFDEWRLQVRCRSGFGNVQISFNVRPIQNIIIVQGTKGVLRIDQMTMFSTRRAAMPLPKMIERVLNAYTESIQTMVQIPRSAVGFVRGGMRQHLGVQALIADFYRTLDENLPVPVSVEQAIPIVDWTERVARAADADAAKSSRLSAGDANAQTVLTGAAGAVGAAVVERFQAQGTPFRVFVRRSAAAQVPRGVHATFGDLGDPDAVDRAIAGARTVIHIGAAMTGNWTRQRTSTVIGTNNVVEACLKHRVDQLIYISSLSVVDWAGNHNGTPITEASPLEPYPERRGAYTQAKLQAELIVRDAVKNRGLRAVILRPGQIFGGTLPLVNSAVARRVGKWHVVLGDGTLRLPLVHMEDVVDAICSAMARHLTGGEIVQLVDANLPQQNQLLKRELGSSAKVVRVPRPVVFAAGWMSEVALRPMRRQSPVSRYRLRSALAHRTFVSQAAATLLDWSPKRGLE